MRGLLLWDPADKSNKGPSELLASPCLRAPSSPVQRKSHQTLGGSHPSLWPQFPHLDRVEGYRLLETLAFYVSKILQPLGVSLLPSPRPALLGPVQPALAGCQNPGGWGGEVISWWERRGWSGWRHELVLPVTLHLWPALQQAGGGRQWGSSTPARLPSPPAPGLRDSWGSRTVQWEGLSLALSGSHCPSWLPARLTRLLGKGPCSLPQALHSGTPTAHPGKRAQRDLLSALSPPRSPGLTQSPGGGRAQPPHQWPLELVSPPPGQVRGPGGACLVMGPRP